MTDSTISLDYPYGGSVTIGYTCVPKLCESAHALSIGDSIVLQMGTVGGRQKILYIGKCNENARKCDVVAKEGLEARNKKMIEIDGFLKRQKECIKKIDREVADEYGITIVKAHWLRTSGKLDLIHGNVYKDLSDRIEKCGEQVTSVPR